MIIAILNNAKHMELERFGILFHILVALLAQHHSLRRPYMRMSTRLMDSIEQILVLSKMHLKPTSILVPTNR